MDLASLLATGCTLTQLRLLVFTGFVEHAVEETKRRARTRSFRSEAPMSFAPGTCFIVTDAGVEFLRDFDHLASAKNPLGERTAPRWDPLLRELWVREVLVKRFRRLAPVLELLLTSFQEMDWPIRIDDPLPPQHDIEPHERLRDAIKRLNRCQRPLMIHFMADGSGRGVRWELVEPTGEINQG